jgi:hypothetical protein
MIRARHLFVLADFAAFAVLASQRAGAGSDEPAEGKTVFWAAPLYFTDSTPVVPARDLMRFEIYVQQEPPFNPADDNGAFAPPEAREYDLANLIPPLSTGVMCHVSLRTVSVWGTKSDFSSAYRFTFRP